MATKTDDPEVITGELSKLQQLPADLVLMKMENETIMAMAAARPRDHRQILAEIKEQLEAYPTFAAAAIYSKPVGRDPDTGKMKYVEGLSVRAAESLREAYGFNRVGTALDPIPGGGDQYRLTATFVDYQKGMVWQDQEILTPWYKSKGGKMTRTPDDRFLNVVVKARRSIAVREVILRSVPAGLKSELFEIAGRLADEKLDDKAIAKILEKFAEAKVTQEMIEGLLGRTSANWSKSDRRTLLGLWNAIQDGEATIAEAFGVSAESKPGEKDPADGAATPETLMSGATVTGKDGQSPGSDDAAVSATFGALIPLAQKLGLYTVGPPPDKKPCLWCKEVILASKLGQDLGAQVVIHDMDLVELGTAIAHLEALEKAGGAA